MHDEIRHFCVKFVMLRRIRQYFSLTLRAACVSAVLAASAHANVVVVLNSGDASVSLLDETGEKELSTFSVGKEPHHLMAKPDKN